MTDATLSRKTRFEEKAKDVVDMIAGRGGMMTLVNLRRRFELALRKGS